MNQDIFNCRQLDDFSLFNKTYVYIDTIDEYQADEIFNSRGVKVKILDRLYKPVCKYSMVICKVSKKYSKEFAECMADLEAKLLILGYHDYEAFCEIYWKELELEQNEELVK